MSEPLDKLRLLLKEEINTIVEEALDKRLGAINALDTTAIKGAVIADVLQYIQQNTKVDPKFSSNPDVDTIDVVIAGKKCFGITVMNGTGINKKLSALEYKMTQKIETHEKIKH